MKFALTFTAMGLSLFSFGGEAQTNWERLISEAPQAVREIGRFNNGRGEFNLARTASGKIRFLGFRSYQAQPAKLTINAKGLALDKLCEQSLILKKPFSATLTVQAEPLPEDLAFRIKGALYEASALQNPYQVLGHTYTLEEGSDFVWTHRTGDFVRYNEQGGPSATLLGLIHDAVKEKRGPQVIDLSEHNGIACDLAGGHVQLRAQSKVRYEKGLPDKVAWIDQGSFQNLFHDFWQDRLALKDRVAPQDSLNADMVLLGWHLGEKNVEKSSVMKVARISNLMAALKHERPGVTDADKPRLSPVKLEEFWNKTAEFGVPKDLLVETSLLSYSGRVVLELEP